MNTRKNNCVKLFFLFVFTLMPLLSFSQSMDQLHGGAKDGLVGKTSSSYSVNYNGQFCYEIPISVLSGVGGLTPKLTISYNSGNSDGLLGYGFDLKGLSMISRAPRNLFNDGISDIIRFNDSDRFSLDGARLQLVKKTDDYREYRTESNNFARIVAKGDVGNPSQFLVYSKDGLTYEYTPFKSSAKNLFWPLCKVSDTKGNYYTITYLKTTSTQILPFRIRYTGNSAMGTQPFASIDFDYEFVSRSVSYISGAKYLRNRAISSIMVKYGSEVVRQYTMAYEKKRGRLFLASITEQAGNEKLNPTVFKWDNKDMYAVAKATYNNGEFKDVKVVTGDFNGDGKMDFLTKANNNAKNYDFYIYLSLGPTYSAPIHFRYSIPEAGNYAVRLESVVAGDFNGDGYDDIVVERSDSPFYWLDLWESQVTDKGQVNFIYKKSVCAPCKLSHTMHVMDTNCDGAADLFLINNNYSSKTYYALMSSYDGNTLSPLNVTASGELQNDSWDYPGCSYFLDLDGDGTNEVLNCKGKKNNGCGSVLYKMSKTGTLTLLTGLTLGGGDYFIVGDFNGDGKSDIITTGDDSNTTWEVNFSKGSDGSDGWFDSYSMSQAYFSQKDKLAYAVDFNGDGFCDIVAVNRMSDAPLEVYINDGTGRNFTKIECLDVEAAKTRLYHFLDATGDGKMEIVSSPSFGNHSVGFDVFYTFNSSSDLLSRVTDGLGYEMNIDYRRLSGDSNFKRGKNHAYPVVSVGNHWPVVSKITIPSSLYGNHQIVYKYDNALYHKRGRGMLGFEKITVTDELTGERTESTYGLNTQLMLSLPMSTKTYNHDVLLREISYGDYSVSFQYNSGNPKEWVYTCLPNATHERSYEFNAGTLVSDVTTTMSYDKFGNVTAQTVDYGNRSVQTLNTYANDESKWFLGRLMKSVVTKSTKKNAFSTSSEFEYDADCGMLVKEKFAPGKQYGYVKTYEYDAFGNIIRDTKCPNDGNEARVKNTEYTDDGRFIKKTIDCLGFVSSVQVDSRLGVKLSETDVRGITTTFQYNVFGEPLSASNPLKATNVVKAWSEGHPYAPLNSCYYIKMEYRDSPTTWEFYDNLGQLLRSAKVSDDSKKIIFQDTKYDDRGQVIAVSEPYFMGDAKKYWTTKKYDQIGRLSSETTPLGATTDYGYSGLVATVTDPKGNISSRTIDNLGQVVESCDALGNIVSYEYDVNGNCTKIVGPRTQVLAEYDDVGNRTKLNDPDLGIVTNTYDAYGNKLTESDMDGTTSYSYDIAGRLIKEERPDYTYTYVYDSQVKGTLSSQTCSNGTSMEYIYDSYGREIQRRETVMGKTFVVQTAYEPSHNRVTSMTYPSGLHIGYRYTDVGSVSSVYNMDSKRVYWNVSAINARGQREKEILGNGLEVCHAYDEEGKIIGIQTPSVSDYAFGYDQNNNLVSKKEKLIKLDYTYAYDVLDRLTHTYLGANQKLLEEINYDEAGNIIYKTGVGNISYFDGTNKISRVSDNSFVLPIWDEISYTSFNKVLHVKKGREEASNMFDTFDLLYGPNKERWHQKIESWRLVTGFGGTMRPVKQPASFEKYYVGSLYEKLSGPSMEKEVNYVMAEGKPVTIVQMSNLQTREYYPHFDNLGSIIACSDESGKVVDRTVCDAWGRKLDSVTGDYADKFTKDSITDRCFTGHEHLDRFRMINMNGRIYSSHLGRFLSPDPFVQAPSNTQSLNRYAYCLNNPLSLTDPSGYHWLGDTFCAIVGIAVGFETGGLGSGIVGALIGGACGGASSALASCLLNGVNLWQTTRSTFVGGFWGAVGGVINTEIGDVADSFIASCALHSVSDGTLEAMQGGHFEHGFFTGLVSSVGNQGIASYGSHLSLEAQLTASAALGGTVSVISGGKFASGAMTAAFQMMYNEQMHRGPYMRDLEAIDNFYQESKEKYPDPHDFYESLGFPQYDNACAARMSYALNKSGVLKIPKIDGITKKGNDNNYYFMFAKDMDAWLSQRRVWGSPRVYVNTSNKCAKLRNGVVSQTGFSRVTGHIEYLYKGHDGGSHAFEYSSGEDYRRIVTKLWKGGFF